MKPRKGLEQDILGLPEIKDPWEMQKEISWNWDSSREHANGHKERRWVYPINRLWFRKRLMT